MSNQFAVIVTGANRGIGRAICDQILTHPDLRSKQLFLHATSRSGDDFGLQVQDGQEVRYHSLDLSDSASIKAFAGKIDGTIDVLINNAGVNLDNQFSLENAQKTLDTNYRGTLAVCEAFLPKMRKQSGRIVNLSSTASGLSIYSSAIAGRFRSSASGSLDDVDALAKEYISSLESGSNNGWPNGKSYSVSKACINAFTAILARDNMDVTINCCCPGWVDTDMGAQVGSNPSKTPDEGARIPVHLALGDIQVTGKYWGNDSISGKGVGKVQSW